MNTNLVRSVVSLVAILGVGTGVSYALFTTGPVSITTSSIGTGTAALKICNTAGTNNWKNSVAPGLNLSNLIPGGSPTALTNGAIFLGNDGGTLPTPVPGGCTSYGDAASSSDVPLEIIPSLANLNCAVPELETELTLEITVGSSTPMTKTLADWEVNTTALDAPLAINGTAGVTINASLATASDDKDAACTFDINFNGDQVL